MKIICIVPARLQPLLSIFLHLLNKNKLTTRGLKLFFFKFKNKVSLLSKARKILKKIKFKKIYIRFNISKKISCIFLSIDPRPINR